MLPPDAASRAAAKIKVCPVCDEVNRAESPECFLCGWRGKFLVDPRAVSAGLERWRRLHPAPEPAWKRALERLRRRLRPRFDRTL